MTDGFLEIGDPDAVMADAFRLETAGENLEAVMHAQAEAISAIEGEQPWGSDQFGVAFRRGYYKDDVPAAAKENMTSLGDEAVKYGSAAAAAMADYSSTDAANAAGIDSVR
jgi:hypothetical protein